MLIEHKPVSTLDYSTRQRLAANAALLISQSQNGVVMFEGHYFSVNEVRSLLPKNCELFLTES